MQVEIYGLYSPNGELRYVGKAKNSAKRFQGHIYAAKNGKYPVYAWIRKLWDNGQQPVLKVLETVPGDAWIEAERRLIAEHRKTSNLLNVADGGDQPSQTYEQRAAAGRAAWKAQNADPKWKRFWNAKRRYSMMVNDIYKREGPTLEYWVFRWHMNMKAVMRPDLYGNWRWL